MAAQPAETMEFQAETRQLLDLMIHSLYKHKEIFLRELISNASDALDKMRFLAASNAKALDGDEHLHIRVEGDAEDRTLLIADNGVGMSRDDLVENLGTIARSGTREFLSQLKDADGSDLPELIGQFGVGFYSAFMVADEVTVDTRRHDEEQGHRWRSKGDGSYSIEPIDKPDRGTTIVLHLKERAETDDAFQDFTQEWTIRETVKRYSDFVAYPIEMEVEREEGEGDDKKTVTRVETLNSMKPLWTRPAAEVTDEEHADFYKHVTKDWEAPRRTIHFKAEGTLEYHALLYLPSHKPLMTHDHHQPKSRLSLYVKRVFIMDDCEELLPPWLRFVRGLVDSGDMPLNVSRETLQHNRQMTPIRKRLTSKVLDTLSTMLDDEREEYDQFWDDFGAVLKEGIYYDDEHKDKVAAISLFQSSKEDGRTTLKAYVERMPDDQKEIYYLAGTDKKSLLASPHLEAFARKGFEVLFLTDPVDEFALQRLTEFDGKALKSIERGQVELEDDDEKEAREEKEKELKPLLERVQTSLDDHVSEVRFSNRLTDSAAVLVTGEHDLTPQMERILRDARQEVPESKRILELNPDHPLVAAMNEQQDDGPFGDYCKLLYGQALLAEGSTLPDPASFNKLLVDLMVKKS